MNRKTFLFTVMAFVIAIVPLGRSQGAQDRPSPVPSDILGPQLIAWSQIQKPEPVTQPSAAGLDAAPQSGVVVPQAHPAEPNSSEPNSSEPNPAQSNPAQTTPNSAQPMETQTFTGTIVKDAGRYVLKASSNVYELDDQERAKKYEGKQVKVTGALDAKGNNVHVVEIELMS